MFLAGVETREAGLLGWWSSERLGWVLVTVLWWVQIGVSLIWFWDCVLVYSAKDEGERKIKPLLWKKMTTGREVVSVSVSMGTKRWNQIRG